METLKEEDIFVRALEKELGVEELYLEKDHDLSRRVEFKGYAVKDRGFMGADERETTQSFPGAFASWRKDGKRYGMYISPTEFVEKRDYDFVGEGMAECYPTLLRYNFRGTTYELSPHKFAEFLRNKLTTAPTKEENL